MSAPAGTIGAMTDAREEHRLIAEQVEDARWRYYVLDSPTIDDAEFDRMEKAKEAKKLEKKFENHVIWGVPNAPSYTQVKFSHPLSKYPKDKLQEAIDKYKKNFKPGEVFLNTNFSALGINAQTK